MSADPILRVAVASPVRSAFDYLSRPGPGGEHPRPGCRVRVPFGKASRIGVVLEHTDQPGVAHTRLKPIEEVLDAEPLLSAETIALLGWASDYYQHPIGDVIVNTLPSMLRRGRPARPRVARCWRISGPGKAVDLELLARRAPRQQALLEKLAVAGAPLAREQLALPTSHWPKALAALVDKGWVEEICAPPPAPCAPTAKPECLSHSQQLAVDAVDDARGVFKAFVLDGVTGSGKTEVYLQLIERTLARGRQAMVLIPEIGLTPQTVSRFEQRLGARLCVLHSGLSDQQRMNNWLAARDGSARVVIGTRSAVFAPLENAGLFVVDEEHDLSFKQQDGFRYSARDVAVLRARRAGVPIVLGSATPSLETINNVDLDRYTRLALPDRVAGADKPEVTIVDVRGKPFEDALSRSVLEALRTNLEREEQSLLFLNRRGYAPALLCHACGWIAECHRCDAHVVYHQRLGRVRCHHCGSERARPLECQDCGGGDLRVVGVGTERVAEALERHFPDAAIARVDRDTTQRKGALQAMLDDVQSRRTDILIGTQMLAKGHHFPHVTLVAVLDADGGLFGADFRASERMAQLLVQVAGRAGRGQKPGRVLIQTHHPEHPLLHALLHHGYAHFAAAALEERRAAAMPPCACFALLRSEAPTREQGFEFLEAAKSVSPLPSDTGFMLLGPVASPLERRAGRYRAQLLVQSEYRGTLGRFLSTWAQRIDKLKAARRVRWSLDVDPQDMI